MTVDEKVNSFSIKTKLANCGYSLGIFAFHIIMGVIVAIWSLLDGTLISQTCSNRTGYRRTMIIVGMLSCVLLIRAPS